ncbi:helix-turn-helix domain-containing protein [Amycolatopsis japonica]|uniref:helix-turn-helix domain-containing protein n=1 Tax=Amycolatopsis japonica TaxID=208439 RepID=UPI00366C4079
MTDDFGPQRALDEMVADQVALMTLLAESAPASAALAVAESIARRVSSESAAGSLRQQTLRVKDLLDRRARRDRDLSALFDTAKDLASLKDLTAILTSIAVRCRELLGTDLAYLSLLDESGTETSIRVTDGTVSQLLRHLRLPIDIGVGGLVARTGMSHQSSDYLRDDRISHNADVDAAVAAEGIKAILGVPLKVSGKLIGILFASHRSQRTFAADEVEMLSSLATLAALAIEKTQLLDQSHEALAEIESAHAATIERQAAIDRAAAAHELFTAIIFRGGGLEELTAALYDVLEIPAVILDADGGLLASVGFPQRPENLPRVPSRDPEAGTPQADREGEWTVIPIDAVHDRLGALALSHPAPLSDVNGRIAARAATVAALLLFWRRSEAETSDRDRSAFLIDVVSRPAGVKPACLPSGAFPNLPDGGDWRVYAIRSEAPDRRLLPVLRRRLGSQHVMHVRYADELVVAFWSLGPGLSAADLAPRLAAELEADVTIGEATSTTGLAGLRDAYEEASMCLKVLHALGRQRTGANRARLGVAGLLLSDSRDLISFVTDHLGPVLEYDRRRGTDLTITLAAYFRTNRSVNETAQDLRVHPNTVTQRLARIDHLLGPDWRDATTALDLQLSLLIHTLVEGLDMG